MAIQPIDLQTLYSQMEKVGKQQGAEQQAVSANRESQQLVNKLETEKNLSSVRQSEALKNDNIAVSRDGEKQDGQPAFLKKKKDGNNGKEDDQSAPNYITDPALGKKIDISG